MMMRGSERDGVKVSLKQQARPAKSKYTATVRTCIKRATKNNSFGFIFAFSVAISALAYLTRHWVSSID